MGPPSLGPRGRPTGLVYEELAPADACALRASCDAKGGEVMKIVAKMLPIMSIVKSG